MRSFVKYFLQGLLYTIPLGVTAYVLYEVFIVLDGLIPFEIPGLGIVLIFLGITAVGFLGSYLISLPLFSFFEGLLQRAPVVKIIYTSVKDLVNAFVGQKKSFNRPVLVKLYEGSEVQRIGFITDESMHNLGLDEPLITVYVPHSYAISGQLFLVPRTYVTPLDVTPADALKYIISGGVTRMEED